MDDEGVLVGQLRALEFWCWTWLREGFSMQATKYKGVCLPRSWGLARFGNLKQLDFEEESGNCHVLSINHSLAGSPARLHLALPSLGQLQQQPATSLRLTSEAAHQGLLEDLPACLSYSVDKPTMGFADT